MQIPQQNFLYFNCCQFDLPSWAWLIIMFTMYGKHVVELGWTTMVRQLKVSPFYRLLTLKMFQETPLKSFFFYNFCPWAIRNMGFGLWLCTHRLLSAHASCLKRTDWLPRLNKCRSSSESKQRKFPAYR